MKKILIVEDEEIVRSNIVEILESEGFVLDQAENGIEAIQKIEKFFPDIIVSDIMMPGMDGYELVKYIQSNPITSSIPVILLTARADSRDVRRGMQYGADDYITKPFRAQDLIEAVNTRISKQKNYNQKFEDLKSNISMYIPHELRTPLVSILGFADLIINSLDDLSKDEISQMASKVKNSGLRLYERIEKFLYFSELELLKTETKPKDTCPIDETLVKNLITTKFKDIDLSKFTITIENSDLKISQDYFSRILIELIDNSIKFTTANPTLKLSGSNDEANYILKLEDNGIGMTADEIKQISAFKQFNREDYQQEGNGLGLAIVNNILELIDGEIEINSDKSVGTTVTVKLPRNK